MIKTTKRIALSGIYVALLLGAQFILSGISGIELVTVLLLAFCFVFGTINGLIVATCFSLLRCFIFGFYPSVIVLYLIYYNLFALFFGFLGRIFQRKITLKKHILIIISAVIFTVFFTLLDDVISCLFFGLRDEALKSYFIFSLYALIPQTVCSFITVAFLFPPLLVVLRKIDL